jgi:P4 family phage/plasmid primase-like protien
MLKELSLYILSMALDQYLKKFITKDKAASNYIKIGDAELNVFGNKYHITKDNRNDFEENYKKHVFENKKEAYLVERQLENGKIAIDLDFRYNSSVTEKQHTNDHINDFIELCMNGFNDLFDNLINNPITFYIFEKENVNCLDTVTKDGIHIIVNILADFPTKILLRNYIVANLEDVWDDLPLKNDWNSVVDEAVMKGNTGWQLYGSRKPGNEAYKLKHIFVSQIKNETIDVTETDIQFIDFNKFFPQFCVCHTEDCNQFDIKKEREDEYLKIKDSLTKKTKLKVANKSKCNRLTDIQNSGDLDNMIVALFDDANTDYTIKEIHNYTIALPKEYWGAGSYDKWIRVCWALKNTNERLILTWLKFCSLSDDFDFMNNDAIDIWDDGEMNDVDGYTFKSIMYWCKTSNPDEYKNIYNKTVDYYIYYSFRNNTECDLANTLFQMFKSQYVCVSIGNNTWYEFKHNRWEINDRGSALRLKISTEMYKKYEEKLFAYQSSALASQNNMILDVDKNEENDDMKMNNMSNKVVGEFKNNNNDSQKDFIKKRNEMSATCKLLKKTVTKNNIMRECQELFWDKDFYNKLDKNSYLLGCTNCVIDFKQKTHRCGKHDDYVSKSTNLNYKTLEYYNKNKPIVVKEINDFMSQLFPDIKNEETGELDVSLRRYMWEHLASTLLGTNENQTFNIYNGSGANGKSKLVELMGMVLGEYKGTVPISLVTQKRSNIGGTSSEIYNLIGTRYAVMQEPSKNDSINEGIVKELTGGDPLQCRALFKDSVTFIPQFKLVVCTNCMFDVKSNDDGTWRRLRKVDFLSKFTDKPYKDPKFPIEDYKYQFKIDQKLDEKFKSWAPVMLSMLVEVAFETQGRVSDVEMVMESTQKYRQDQDIILEFHNAMINPTPSKHGHTVKSRDLMVKFNDWFSKMYVSTRQPHGKELTTYFEAKYGKYPNGGWLRFSYKSEYADVDGLSV